MPDAEQRLLLYPWPGNIRELANVMERVALLVEEDGVKADMLDLLDTRAPLSAQAGAPPASLADTMREHLRAALQDTAWNISQTATRLGISRNTVRARIERFELRPGGKSGATGRGRARIVLPPAPGPDSPRVGAPPATPATVRWEMRRLTCLRALLTGH